MPDPLTPGPWRTLPGPAGTSVPFYIVTFDENGVCTSPATLDHLVGAAATASDVFLFSHGWNNDWATATSAYDAFVSRYVPLRRAQWEPPTRRYAPVLVGVVWPSAILVSDDEQAPDFAGAADLSGDGRVLDEVAVIASRLPAESLPTFYALTQLPALDAEQSQQLADMLAPVLADGGDELHGGSAPDAGELLAAWRDTAVMSGAAPRATGGFIDDDAPAGGGAAGAATPPAPADPEAAGLLDWLKPRDIIRATTVLLMKDRAGRVGGNGVAAMLRRLVEASPDSRVHLVGHSYGGKVVLSALCNGPAPARQVESVLLLQPAMSAFCFASQVPGGSGPGGYRPALDRSRQPVLTTFSSHDMPLTKVFHLAVRRASDLGEAVIAGLPIPPSRYAALGGYGPQGLAEDEVAVVLPTQPPQRYDVSPGGARVIALQADTVISGHGDVQNDATAWALLSQVMG